jgi:hypothetical protein
VKRGAGLIINTDIDGRNTASRNASPNNPVRFLVFFVKQTGVPAPAPAK